MDPQLPKNPPLTSTRRLIAAALICGLVILVAGAVLLFTSAR